MFFRLLTVIVNNIKGFIIFRKADCPQLGNHQEQHVGTKQEEPHGGPRSSQSSPSSEVPLSYLENRNCLERPLCCDEPVFLFVISSVFTTSSLQCPPPPRSPGPGEGGISENTGRRWQCARPDDSIWWAYGSFRQICKSFWGNYGCHHSKIPRTTNRNAGCWIGEKMGNVGIRILIKLQSASLPQPWNTIQYSLPLPLIRCPGCLANTRGADGPVSPHLIFASGIAKFPALLKPWP